MLSGRNGWGTCLPDFTNSFLAGSVFDRWAYTPLAGDASTRGYQRLTGADGRTAILMHTPPDQVASQTAFLRIGAHLLRIGLCAPQILLVDLAKGLLVIEDLGTRHFAQWLAAHPAHEPQLYSAAVDVLIAVQADEPPTGLIALSPAHAARMISPLTEYYAPNAPLDPLVAALEAALILHAPDANTLALRDFHAENLIWRPDLTGTDRVGLLDFQDAVLAPPEYDLVSLLRDARRDVPQGLCDAMMDKFACATGRDPGQTRAASACLGVQRNLRILGIFARLARRDDKTRYLDLLPRVWGHILADLQHPALAELAPLVAKHIPAPT
jgi:N-acetylmuramate 1-kinase